MDITIRKAIATDCPRMMELIQELAVYEKEPDAVTVSMEHFVESGFGAAPVWCAFVAEMDGRVQGFALYYIRYSTWKGQRMYLEDLLVTEALRGRGAGRLLMERLIEECHQKKYSGLVWQVLEWNEPAIRFYEKLGNVRFDKEWINCSIDIK
jgi:GNAT superfamily N-acetyltransferase